MLYTLSYVQGESLIQHNDQEIIKVGFSSSWDRRLQDYKSKLPLPVRVFGVTEGTRDDERELHLALTSYRASGEWYYYTEDLMDTLQDTFRIEPYEVARSRKKIGTAIKATKPSGPRKARKNSTVDQFIHWIDFMKPGETYFLADFYKLIEPKLQRSLKTQLNRPTSVPSKHIAAKGIVREAVKRKGTKFYYAH